MADALLKLNNNNNENNNLVTVDTLSLQTVNPTTANTHHIVEDPPEDTLLLQPDNPATGNTQKNVDDLPDTLLHGNKEDKNPTDALQHESTTHRQMETVQTDNPATGNTPMNVDYPPDILPQDDEEDKKLEEGEDTFQFSDEDSPFLDQEYHTLLSGNDDKKDNAESISVSTQVLSPTLIHTKLSKTSTRILPEPQGKPKRVEDYEELPLIPRNTRIQEHFNQQAKQNNTSEPQQSTTSPQPVQLVPTQLKPPSWFFDLTEDDKTDILKVREQYEKKFWESLWENKVQTNRVRQIKNLKLAFTFERNPEDPNYQENDDSGKLTDINGVGLDPAVYK
jgi:hypothetical protein